MINGRLLASGCSFTDYCWSTWADILGKEFQQYMQVGTGGCDNATIARSIIDNAKPGDTVVILWTSFDRWSGYLDEGYPMPKDQNNHWRHRGSLLRWDKKFYVDYFHPVERFYATIDYINLVNSHSQVHGYQAYHFPAFPLLLAELYDSADSRNIEIYDRYRNQIKNNYLDETALSEFRENHYKIRTSNKYSKDDTHPTPLCHWEYLEKVIAPKLNVTLDQTKKDKIMQEHENLIKHGIIIK